MVSCPIVFRASSYLLFAASSCSFLSRSVLALPKMSSAPASGSSLQLAASDGLMPCFAATWESVSCSFATSSATFILNWGL